MAWPTEAGSVAAALTILRPTPPGPIILPSRLLGGPWIRPRYQIAGRGLYRVFNEAVYRFYRSNAGPPAETDSPYATSATLPATPADTFADGTWWIACSRFNGVIDSGFLPVGPNGEPYLRLDLSGGAEAESPPAAPAIFRLEPAAGGVVRVIGFYWQTGDLRADSWAIAYSIDGSDPDADAPDLVATMPTSGPAILDYALPAQVEGATVKVRLQTRRATAYSEDSVVLTARADVDGPTSPLDLEVVS